MNEIRNIYYTLITMIIILVSPLIFLVILGYFINLSIVDIHIIVAISLIIFLLFVCIFLKFTIVDE